MDTLESLREQVSNLTRLKQQADLYCQQNELLLKGLERLLANDSIDAIYRDMFSVFSDLLHATHGMVLSHYKEDVMHTIASTHNAPQQKYWEIHKFLKRILSGKTAIVFDCAKIPEWQSEPQQTTTFSAIFCPIHFQDKTDILILISDQRGFFSKQDQMLLDRFAIFSRQTLANIRALNIAAEKEQLKEEKRRAEENLLQAEKMSSLGQLSAGVAHEINNPLSFIISNIKSLQEYNTALIAEHQLTAQLINAIKDNDQDNMQQLVNKLESLCAEEDIDFIIEDSQDMVEETIEGLNRIKSIVSELKLFAHRDDNEWVMKDINECVKFALKITNSETKFKCVTETDLAELTPIACKPSKLEQLLINMLINASQAIEEKGHIWITTRQADSCITISIKDDGKGIPKQHIKQLFDPFFTTKPIGVGSGLGLSISYGIAKEHGGDIQVISQVNEGAEFIVTLRSMHNETPKTSSE